MASDHPAKKKIRITNDSDNENSDETDFVKSKFDATNLLSLQLSLPSSDSETSLKGENSFAVHATLSNNETTSKSFTSAAQSNENNYPLITQGCVSYETHLSSQENLRNSFNQVSFNSVNTPYPQIISHVPLSASSVYCHTSPNFNAAPVKPAEKTPLNSSPELVVLEQSILKQCLCGVSESTLRKPLQLERIEINGSERVADLCEWPMPKIFHFLSCLHLLFDIYLKQNNKGFVCPKLLDICTALVQQERRLIEQIFQLSNVQNKIVNYLTSRVLSSYFIIAKTNIDNMWLECLISNLSVENNYNKLNFGIEIIKRIVEWKDVDLHVLEEEQVISGTSDTPGVSGIAVSPQRERDPNISSDCNLITLTDHESFDTSQIKCLIIKKLETKWPELVKNIETLITRNLTSESEFCVLNFLSLWESIISVRANLSVVETKPFYAHLEKFVRLLNYNLSILIWRQLLSLFNEVLCYGSTLALQDLLPEETCALAHLIVRYVKDFRLLDSLPYRRTQPVYALVGATNSTLSSESTNIDKTLLQKMALLVLKSVAITVKETRSDSSDSSIGSDDYDFNQDMQLIERSIRDVLKKLDYFIKNSLEFHPECPFTKVLIHLFSDQDDYMIESMVCTLDITVGIFYRNSVFPDLITMLNPFNTFIEFLKIVSQDSDVLLDYLVSNETCFLLYLLRFLKYVRRNWSKFVYTCENQSSVISSRSEGGGLDATMAVLIRLRLQINRLVSKQLFPYNISPVLRLLETCENLYEGNELT